jgi:putative Holliday junction resolvase
MKLIGLDYGRRRVGLAVTDETGEFIRSLPTIDRAARGDRIKALCEVIDREKPQRIVVGLPLDPRDEETAMSHEIRGFAATLEKACSLPVEFVDESLTSRRAYDIIRVRRKKHRRAKENIDRIAACLILEAFVREKQCG